MRAPLLIALLLLLLLGAVSCAELPKPTDEEDSAKVSPEHMKCDACAGSLFHIWWKFKKWYDKFPNRRMRESEILETVDEACMPKSFATTYGIKKVGDKHHLSGDGLKWFGVQSPTVGTLQPGMWLTDACRVTQGEIGEEELYQLFRIYHVEKGIENSDVHMFREVCIKRRKQCTLEEGLETYDRFEAKDLQVELVDI